MSAATDSTEQWKAEALLVVHGLAGVIWIPASQVLIHRIVGAELVPSAVRLNATGRYLAFLVGPAVGGGLLLAFGALLLRLTEVVNRWSPTSSSRILTMKLESLRDLGESLRQRGSGLVIREGRPEDVLPDLARQLEADAVYFAADVSPFATSRDLRVGHQLQMALV